MSSSISIIVIGRNEGLNLPSLRDSLEPLLRSVACETIYVDSDSSDGSSEISRRLFDRTIVLEGSPWLNASAARFTGVLKSTQPWLLFLDGDMVLSGAFVKDIVDHVASASSKSGLVGVYVHSFPDGSERRWQPERDAAGRAIRFGGALLLHRRMIELENWNPRLFSSEEIDLYARLRRHGFDLRASSGDFIVHRTDLVPIVRRLTGNFWPKGSYLGKKFFGMGQLLRARWESRDMMNLIRWFPGPFVIWACLLASLVLFLFGLKWSAAAILVLGVLIVGFRYSFRAVVYFLGMIPQIAFGMRRYERHWVPAVRHVWDRE